MRLAIVTRNKPDRAGTLPLYVRVSHGGRKRYVSLGIRIPRGDWNPRKREVRSTNAHADDTNRVIRERLSAAQAAVLDLQARARRYTADDAKGAVLAALRPGERGGGGVPDVVAYARAMLDGYEARGQYSAAVSRRTGVNALNRYLGGRPLRFLDVTPDFARAYAAHLRRSFKPNTANNYLGSLSLVARRAEEAGVPGAAEAVRALRRVKIKTERVEKRRLTFDQIRALEALRVEGELATVRDWFVFAAYVGGMWISDVALLRWEHVDTTSDPWHVRWRQHKTREGHSLPALGAAAEILRRRHGAADGGPFVFGLMDERAAGDPRALRNRINALDTLANTRLRDLCQEAGVPVVTFHAARHSIADHLRRSGLSVYDISKVLGHANPRITESYLRDFDREDLDAKLRQALQGAPGGGSSRR